MFEHRTYIFQDYETKFIVYIYNKKDIFWIDEKLN